MQKKENIKDIVPKLYQKAWLDTACYFFITGARCANDELAIEKAAVLLQQYFGLDEDELSVGTMRAIYHRVNNEMRSFKAETRHNPFVIKVKNKN